MELTAVADPGWEFTGWSGDLGGTANPDTIVMTGDRTVQANFALIPPVFLSDDFNRCALGTPWTFVDPFSDGGTATMAGGWTDNARVAISVPGGSEHEIWNGFIGAPHVLQPAEDVDFTVEAKFDSDLPGNFGQEGILIKESESRWIRAEIFRDETNRLRVAVDRGPSTLTHDVYMPLGLTAPLWMRVTRTGDTWVQSWSSDGVNFNVAGGPFTYNMVVSAIGLFAGNRGVAPPAHTVLVDYIHNTAGVPAVEDAARAPLDGLARRRRSGQPRPGPAQLRLRPGRDADGGRPAGLALRQLDGRRDRHPEPRAGDAVGFRVGDGALRGRGAVHLDRGRGRRQRHRAAEPARRRLQ